MIEPNEAIDKARVADPKELRRRKNILLQLVRFAAINIKMLKIISKGHSH